MFCKNCGKKVKNAQEVCPSCGENIELEAIGVGEVPPPMEPPKQAPRQVAVETVVEEIATQETVAPQPAEIEFFGIPLKKIIPVAAVVLVVAIGAIIALVAGGGEDIENGAIGTGAEGNPAVLAKQTMVDEELLAKLPEGVALREMVTSERVKLYAVEDGKALIGKVIDIYPESTYAEDANGQKREQENENKEYRIMFAIVGVSDTQENLDNKINSITPQNSDPEQKESHPDVDDINDLKAKFIGKGAFVVSKGVYIKDSTGKHELVGTLSDEDIKKNELNTCYIVKTDMLALTETKDFDNVLCVSYEDENSTSIITRVHETSEVDISNVIVEVANIENGNTITRNRKIEEVSVDIAPILSCGVFYFGGNIYDDKCEEIYKLEDYEIDVNAQIYFTDNKCQFTAKKDGKEELVVLEKIEEGNEIRIEPKAVIEGGDTSDNNPEVKPEEEPKEPEEEPKKPEEDPEEEIDTPNLDETEENLNKKKNTENP